MEINIERKTVKPLENPTMTADFDPSGKLNAVRFRVAGISKNLMFDPISNSIEISIWAPGKVYDYNSVPVRIKSITFEEVE